jgi:hypothetical protein
MRRDVHKQRSRYRLNRFSHKENASMTKQANNQPQLTQLDCPVAAPKQDEITGGAAYLKLGDTKGDVTMAATAPQTREHILLARQTV